MAAIGTILDDGDGYKQLVQVEYKQVTATKANHNEAEVATSTAGVSTPKRVKRTAVPVPVTVSAKKARR